MEITDRSDRDAQLVKKDRRNSTHLSIAAFAVALLVAGCSSREASTSSGGGRSGGSGGIGSGGMEAAGGSTSVSTGSKGSTSTTGAGGHQASSVVVTVSPPTATVAPGGTQTFTATVTGTTNTAVTWSANGGTISSDGLFTAPADGGAYVLRATSVADPTTRATAIVNVIGGAAAVDPFYDTADPYVQIMTPMPYATYFAPATIRVWGHAPDYLGSDSAYGFAPEVDFYLGTTMVGAVKASNRVDYYQLDITGVAAGSYELYARSLLSTGTVESIHVPITVIDVPATTGPTQELTSDIVLSGNMNFEVLGTATARGRLTSKNGSRIRSASGWTGHLTIKNTDILGLGSMDVPGIEVTAQGTNTIDIENSVFDRCGPPSITANDQAQVTFRGNTLQPNTLTPVNDEADYAGSHPSITLSGNSSAVQVFAGNNVGVSFARLSSSHLTIGGNTDADGNIFLGVRAGMEVDNSTDVTIRGNFSYHRYPFGWSQGHNLDFEGSVGTALVEHNVFRGSSWMIQGVPGKIRYNLLVDNINEAFFRLMPASTEIHHNVLVNVGYQRMYSPSGGVGLSKGSFYNNTVDVGGKKIGWFAAPFASGGSLTSVRNNVFTGFAYQTQTNLIDVGAAMSADYNCIYNPDTTLLTPYGDSGLGAHDSSADPKFSQPRIVPFPIGDGDIWLRKVTVSQILALYRGLYTPAAGSPLIDAGDPSDASGTDIGAVGAGQPDPNDQFGLFGK